MKFTKPKLPLIIFLIIVSLIILYFKNNSVSNNIANLIARQEDLKVQITNMTNLISTRTQIIQDKKNEIIQEKISLEKTKEIYDIKNLNRITGYTVRSYSTRRGNHTNTRNYINYH